MKRKLLNGVANNVCASLTSITFRFRTEGIEYPQRGKWIIDMKKGISKNENGEKLDIPISEELKSWFISELEKMNGTLEDIESAEVVIGFDFNENLFGTLKCSCEIISGGKKYSGKVIGVIR